MAETGYAQQPYAQGSYTNPGGSQGLGAQFTAVIQGGIDMASYPGSKPIRTERDNETKIILVDGASPDTATNALSIVQPGDTLVGDTNDFGTLVVGLDTAGDYQAVKMETDGTVHVTHPGEITVNATDLDIRPLTNADVVTVEDGGGSITVDAVALDIRLLTNADVVTIEDGGGSITVDGAVSVDDGGGSITVDAVALDIRPLTNADVVTIEDGGGSITVDATDLDIRALDATTDNVAISDGTNTLSVNADGSINVNIQPDAGDTDVINFNETISGAVGTPANHDYVVPSGETFHGEKVIVGSRGAVEVKIGTWNGTAFTTLMHYWQDPKENREVSIPRLTLTGNGTLAVRIIVTPRDGAADDIHSTLQGYLNA